MIVTSKKFLISLILLGISACSSIGKTEISTLEQAAIQDAQNAPKKLKLGYMKCYALDSLTKEKCHQILNQYSQKRKNAESWAYITPFDNEMELQGFAVFLRDEGKICSALEKSPTFNSKTKTYSVTCKNGKNYTMDFCKESLSWR